MAKKYTYQFVPAGESGYDPALTQSTVTGAQSSQTILTTLFNNGVEKSPFGDVSGFQYINGQVPTGNSSNPADPDILALDSGALRNALIWDERTTSFGQITPYNFYQPGNLGQHSFVYTDGDGRYGLPGGGSDQTTAIDVIKMGQGASYNASVNIVNLGYNAAGGGIAYNTQVTIIGGPGRDLLIGGEAADVLYGGDDHSGIGEGIWGGGGGDTIYGGANTGQSINPGGPGDSGSDDLYGYAGNDIIYGGNDGDVYYGDSGNDVIYGAGASGVGTFGSGYNGDWVTFFGGDGNDTLYASANVGSNGVTQTREFFFGGNPYGVGTGNLWRDRAFIENPNSTDSGTLDVVSYQNAGTAVTVNLNGSVAYNEGPEGQAIANGTLMGTGAGGAVGDVFFGIEGVIGGTQGDTLTGNSVANFLSGLGGNDRLFGGAGADTLYGGLGVDTLFGGTENDSLDGGGGGDSVFGDAGSDIIAYANDIAIDGLGNNDSVLFNNSQTSLTINITTAKTTASDLLDGGADTDTLILSSTSDVLVVNSNDLTRDGVVGANVPGKIAAFEVIDAGAGDDIVALNDAGGSVWATSVTVAGGTGNDLIATGSANDTIFAGTLGDTASATAGGDTLYGGAGIDLMYGSAGNDTLSGGAGVGDVAYGGGGNDLFLAFADANATGNTTGFDGTNGTGINVNVANGGRYQVADVIFGGGGTDTLNLDDGSGNPAYYNAYSGGGALQLTSVEIIAATALADVINLTNAAATAYASDVTIAAGNAGDWVFSGSGNDTIFGDSTAAGVGSDTLFGGNGNDLIFGDLSDTTSAAGLADSIMAGAGNDTVFAGGGNDTVQGEAGLDSLFGGEGNDLLQDNSNAVSIDGGGGSDTINVAFTQDSGVVGTFNGGLNSGTDLADLVSLTGDYNSVTSSLGLGNDIYRGSMVDLGGAPSPNIDTVFGGDASDVIAGWVGNDVLSGDAGDDVLWGGAGSDTIFGGTGSDYLYPGDGGSNVMYGGTGIDYYYMSRTDGAGNQLYDEFRDVSLPDPGSPAENYLVVLPVAVQSGDSDNLLDGSGVYDNDVVRNIMDNDGNDMVQVVYNGGTSYTLSVLSGAGAGTNVTFDGNDISQIVLWNNGGTVTGHTFQVYQYNSVAHTYDFVSEFG